VWRSKIISHTGNQTQIISPSASSSLLNFCSQFPLKTAQHVSVIFTVFNNVEVIWNRNVYFRHHIYCMYSQHLKYLV